MKFSVETIDRKDYAAVRGIIADSYKNDGPNTDGDEVDMVDRLRSGEGYQSQFEVVAKDDNHQVIGHALMVPATVRSATHKFPIVSIVEIGVLSKYRNHGVGQEMVIELETRLVWPVIVPSVRLIIQISSLRTTTFLLTTSTFCQLSTLTLTLI